MRRLTRRFILLFAVLALVAAACGDDDAGSDTTTTTTAATTTTTAAPATTTTTSGGGDTTTTTVVEDPTAAALISLEDECLKYDGLQAPDGYRANLVTDIGKVDDGTFNQFAYEGLLGAVACFGIDENSFIETVSEADYASNIATSLESDPDFLVTVGFLITTDTEEAALANPDVDFLGIDQFIDGYPPNMIGVQFNEHEGGFIVGVLAASLSESGVIGVVAGREDVPPVVKYVNGYRRGAESVNPDVRVLQIYNESFNDPAKGASDANQFIGEGADVIFGAGGPTGSGGVVAATDAGLWGIGVDQDEYFTTYKGGEAAGAEFLASSAVKRVDLAVMRNIAASIRDEFVGDFFFLTAENLGITYAPFHDAAVPEDVALAVEATRAGLADGSISTGVCGILGGFIGEGSLCD